MKRTRQTIMELKRTRQTNRIILSVKQTSPCVCVRLFSDHPVIEDVCIKVADRVAGSLQAKTWNVGKCSLRLVLKKESWTTLLSHLHVPPGLTLQQAYDKRVAVTKAEQQQEIHRDLCVLRPEHRLCREKYRDDGIMLPFGHSKEEFTVPNPCV